MGREREMAWTLLWSLSGGSGGPLPDIFRRIRSKENHVSGIRLIGDSSKGNLVLSEAANLSQSNSPRRFSLQRC